MRRIINDHSETSVTITAFLILLFVAGALYAVIEYKDRVPSDVIPIRVEEQGDLLRFVTYDNIVECPNIAPMRSIAARVVNKPGRGKVVAANKFDYYMAIDYLDIKQIRIVIPNTCVIIEQ